MKDEHVEEICEHRFIRTIIFTGAANKTKRNETKKEAIIGDTEKTIV